ncbi:MAG: hypothetical protein JWN14_2196 [Chthonomonadales bacterium]|nr:hypothetical protein [Chthonomonadales bacterium]
MTDGNATEIYPSSSLAWLADAPLFIDERQINAFYDAVVMPQAVEGKTVLETGSTGGFKVSGKGTGTAELSTSGLLHWFPFLSGKASVSAEAGGEYAKSNQDKSTIELLPIATPQRQLVQLALHYSANLQDRLQFIEQEELPSQEWRTKEFILRTPRSLCFIELPGLEDASKGQLTPTKLIPTAAEFADGEVVLLYNQMRSADGRTIPPEYPKNDPQQTEAFRQGERKKYWEWFDENFSATKATVIVEQAAKEHGRVRWIDFRLPISKDGDTLHLHIYPAEKYDIGSFAYNFIQRGYKHGLRIVGTLKSEPDVNVLAIFEK